MNCFKEMLSWLQAPKVTLCIPIVFVLFSPQQQVMADGLVGSGFGVIGFPLA